MTIGPGASCVAQTVPGAPEQLQQLVSPLDQSLSEAALIQADLPHDLRVSKRLLLAPEADLAD
eukprot:CAMPEP_0179117986 /NCGR_PEP_ID=MMETSP0796-20121207/55452_1 /TAXON_ID=73915 /ORGANISM="Pyrodinium bahamense, Strain pbaha01" /LENGTH=62 /DNA_ID=CAMNT_0020816393 /DNA_START=736 /DNA_END=924 /DNA_ORIENTATION=-